MDSALVVEEDRRFRGSGMFKGRIQSAGASVRGWAARSTVVRSWAARAGRFNDAWTLARISGRSPSAEVACRARWWANCRIMSGWLATRAACHVGSERWGSISQLRPLPGKLPKNRAWAFLTRSFMRRENPMPLFRPADFAGVQVVA